MSPRSRRVLVLAAAVPVMLVACGGGEAGVPVEAWRTQAEQVCARARLEAEALRPATGWTTPAGPLRAAAESARTQAENTAELGTPEGLDEEADDYLEALELQAEALDALAEAVLDDPTAASGPAGTSVDAANARVNATATALGIPGCTTAAGSTTKSEAGSSPEPPAEPGLGGGGTQEE